MAANYVANRFTNGRPEWGTTSGGHRWLLAGVFLAEGDGDAALELLAPLEEALPGQYEVLAGLGFARFLRGELEQAKGYLEKAMTIRQPKGRRIPRASKLLICGLFQEGRVLAQDGTGMMVVLPGRFRSRSEPTSFTSSRSGSSVTISGPDSKGRANQMFALYEGSVRRFPSWSS